MALQSRIYKWGSGLAVRIPKTIAEEWVVAEGTAIELTHDSDGLTIRKRRYTLNELLEGIKDVDLPREIDWGPSRGKEIW